VKKVKATWKLNEFPMSLEEFTKKLFEMNKNFIDEIRRAG
jgi:hypothetical protein